MIQVTRSEGRTSAAGTPAGSAPSATAAATAAAFSPPTAVTITWRAAARTRGVRVMRATRGSSATSSGPTAATGAEARSAAAPGTREATPPRAPRPRSTRSKTGAAAGRHTARHEGRAARQAQVPPPVAGGTAAPVAPDPLDAPPRKIAARGERHHDAPPAPPTRQRDRGAGARRAEVFGGQRRRGLERLRIARVDLERHRHGRGVIAHRRPHCRRWEALISSGRKMAKKLFVGNLAYGGTEDELRELVAQAGTCESVSIVTDRDTGQSRGFGFVTMASAEDAERAKKQLDGTDLKGRRLRVDDAADQSTRPRGGAPRGPRH